MLVALVVVAVTGWDWLDPVVALVVAAVVAVDRRAHPHALLAGARRRDAARPRARGDPRRGHRAFAERGIVGFHELRGRQAGARRHVDLHVQFRSGISLEEAHGTAHTPPGRDPRAPRATTDVLIHLEPEDRVRPGEEITTGERPGAQSRLIAADAPTTRKTAA